MCDLRYAAALLHWRCPAIRSQFRVELDHEAAEKLGDVVQINHSSHECFMWPVLVDSLPISAVLTQMQLANEQAMRHQTMKELER